MRYMTQTIFGSLYFATGIIYALPFNILPTSQLPTSYPALATYTVTNNTQITFKGSSVEWLPPNTSVLSTSSCHPQSAFDLAPGASCTLNLSVSGTINKNDANPSHHLFICASDKMTCAGVSSAHSLNVEQPTPAYRFAYVTDPRFPGVNVCSTNGDGTLGPCLTEQTAPGFFNEPNGITFNNQGNLAYVTNKSGHSVTVCPLNNDGSFGTCFDSGQSGVILNSPKELVFNNSGSLAYIPTGNTVTICPVKSNGKLGVCYDSDRTGENFNDPSHVTLNQQGTFAYITNSNLNSNSEAIVVCPIINEGKFGECFYSGATGVEFHSPQGLYFNSSQNWAYVLDKGLLFQPETGKVSKCDVLSNGHLGTCHDSGAQDTQFDYVQNLAFNADDSYAYITNFLGDSVTVCPVASDGYFGVCFNSGSPIAFDGAEGIALH